MSSEAIKGPFSGPNFAPFSMEDQNFLPISDSVSSIASKPCETIESPHTEELSVEVYGTVENIPPSVNFSCSDCGKKYANFSNLKRHVSKVHPTKLCNLNKRPLKEYEFKCKDCACQFSQLKHLRAHERQKHPAAAACVLTTQRKTHKCLLCGNYFERQNIILHFERDHDIRLEIEYLDFSTFQAFYDWKENIEKDTCSKFILENTPSKLKNLPCHSFVCHRSGFYESKSQGLRHVKIQGSGKINGFCPASIKVVEGKHGRFSVTYRKTHIGHKNDIKYQSLLDSERKALAIKIASGIPFDNILDEVRDSVSESGLKRLHLLTRKDLYNIEQSYNLCSDAVRHKDDAISVEAWINEMKSNDDSCVLFYKRQGMILEEHSNFKLEDFILIIMNDAQSEILQKFGSDCVCIDSTHGLNSYNFELVTLLIIDDVRQGFPCAFLISNRTDQAALSLFFSCIKAKVGSLKPKVFMSDMAESFFNAWMQEMEEPENRLYCSWHVDRAWRKNLRKIKNSDKQLEVYKVIRTLLEESDCSAFTRMLSEAMKRFLNDPEIAEFAAYFDSYYLKNVSLWAYCYRLHCGINTNMHIERMHRTLKYVYLHGKNVKRLDKSIHAIMKFVRDRLFDRLLVLHKGKLTTKIQEIRKRHKASENSVCEILETECGWTVASSSGKELYAVQEVNTDCPCQLICTDCNSCIHQYTCSCIDSAIKWNMCKHIHLICKFKNKQSHAHTPIQLNEDTNEINRLCIEISEGDTETEVITKQLKKINGPATAQESAFREIRRENLRKKYNDLISSLSTTSEFEIMEQCCKSLQARLDAVRSDAGPISLTNEAVAISSNKRIIQQRNLYSTKKARKMPARTISKPNEEERHEIAMNLIIDQEQKS